MKPRVLIVDDSLTVRMDLSEAFDAAGFTVARSADLASARQALETSSFSLIVLDVLLPDGDGIEFLKELKSRPDRAAVPVVLLSTEAEVQDRVRGLRTGADEYVGKPYDAAYVIARAKELVRSTRQQPGEARMTVLIVDCSETFREEVKERLEGAGYRVLAAATGEDGLHTAINERPAAVIVDSKLPGIDGRTVIRRIRDDAVLRRTPCLFLTGSEDRSEELRALEAGADSFVHKNQGFPVILARLAAVLRLAGAPAVLEYRKSVLGPKKILAVDDSNTYLHELAGQLRQGGFDTVVARSGQEAIDLLAVQPVDCILLDLIMPGLSGQETCRRIKSDPALRDIPLLILTGVEERAAMIDGINAGADDYILKSSDFEALRARMRAALRRKQFEDENRDIREQILRRELEAADARVHLAAEAADLGIWHWDLNTGELSWTDKCRALFGLTPEAPVTHEAWLVSLHPEDRERTRRLLADSIALRSDYDTEYRVIWPDGSLHWILAKGRAIYDDAGREVRMVGVAQDITDRKRGEERLRQAQKLESIGLLAGGIAHDFNNLLTAILGNASLLEGEAPRESQPKVQSILAASERAADLTRQLLAYAGKGQFVVEPIDMSKMVREMTELLCASIPKKVSLQQALEAELPPVEADPGQIQQIVMNLVLNAAEAIPRDQAGSIYIRTTVEHVTLSDKIIDDSSHETLAAGTYVCLEVRDTGIGMDEQVKGRIFEPFFTTKFTGRGLGLPAAAGVVKAHHGAIQVTSAEGSGSTFRIFLPAASRVDRENSVAGAGDLRGAGTVLIVDDEPLIRDFARSALEQFGYNVLTAKDGREAIGVFGKNAAGIKLVLLDLTMPVMSGKEALEALKQKCPGVKVILMSGYGESEAVRLFAGNRVSSFIQKPFTAASLGEQVKATLIGEIQRQG